MSLRPRAERLADTPGAYLTRGDLAELGLPRGAIDVVFRKLDEFRLPGYARPLVRADDFRAFMESCRKRDGIDVW